MLFFVKQCNYSFKHSAISDKSNFDSPKEKTKDYLIILTEYRQIMTNNFIIILSHLLVRSDN